MNKKLERSYDMNYINTLHEGDNISEVYFCKTKTVAQSKNGKTYYSLVLQDRTGTLDAKVWDLSNAIAHFEALDFIKVDGQITVYNNSLQMSVRRIQKAQEGTYDEAEYMPCTKYNVDEMFNELLGFVISVKNEYLSKLLKSFFVDDANFVKRFKKHSAAKAVHHNFIGGLLQHTLAVTKMCDFLASSYEIINRDLLITAAICHDIGKLHELSKFPENDYTDEGNLLGHIVMGAMMVRDKANEIEGFPSILQSELEHCILAHHGELEYGSPKKPELVEAVALSFADNTDAKLESFRSEAENSVTETGWIGYSKWFDSNIRKTTV